MSDEIRYQVTRYGTGFHGPGHRWLGSAIRVLRRKLREVDGPFTIDDPANPADGRTERVRAATLAKVRERMQGAKSGVKLIIRGSSYDQPGFAIRKIEVAPPHPLVDAARRYLGNTYLLGAVPPPRADCSGLTLKVVQEVYGITLPHQALQQAADPRMDIFRDPTNLEPDDFIFYVYGRLGEQIDHVALFVGPGQEIGARPSTNGVAITAIDWNNVKCFGRLKT